MRSNSITPDKYQSFAKVFLESIVLSLNRSLLTFISLLTSVFLIMSGCSAPQESRTVSSDSDTKVKTTYTPINASDQKTYFPLIINDLKEPIAMAYTPDNRIFISERRGYVRVVENGKLRTEPYVEINVPKLTGYNETGVLGIAVDPEFKTRPYLYIYRTYSKNGRLYNKVIRVTDVNGSARDPIIILDDIPGGRTHNGGIILFGPDGNLYVATGDTGDKQLSQNLNSLAGKILRIEPNGEIPPDNPFRNSPVYSFGHRNIFGMAFEPETGDLYVTENGPSNDDEINKIVSGGNYGWPLVTGSSNDQRYINPVKTYQTTIVPTQAIFYSGSIFRSFKDWFIFSTYKDRDIRALKIANSTGSSADNIGQEKIIYLAGEPLVGVSQSPDGGIYMIGNDAIKKLVKFR